MTNKEKVIAYSSIWVHRVQTLWIITMAFISAGFVRLCDWSLWVSIPVAIIGFLLVSWAGISIIAMFDHNHRKAARYGVKIENLPLYFSLFEKLTELEAQDINSSEIPSEVKDTEDWLQFCRWQAIENLNKLQHGDETK